MQQPRPVFMVAAIYGLWTGVCLAVYGLSPLLPQTLRWYPGLFAATVVVFVLLGCLVNTFYLIWLQENLHRHPGVRLAFFLLVSAAAGLMYAAAQHWLIKAPVFYMVYTANLLVLANLLGSWMATVLQRQAELIMVCLVMALADLFSLISGPTMRFIRDIRIYYESGLAGPPPAVDFLLIKVPVPGLVHLQPLFGVSDWIIVVFLSAAAARFHINDNLAGKGPAAMAADRKVGLYFPLGAAALMAAILAAGFLDRFIPALPVIGAVFSAFILIRYSSARQLLPTDWLLMAVFTAVLLGLLGLGLGLTG